MIKSILGGKSKNLFDISKVITSNVVKRNGNSLICSVYGTSIGTLGSICPTLKPSDLITISFKCASEGAASNFMSISNTSGGLKIFRSGETFNVSEVGLSSTWYLYSTDYEHRDIPNKTTYSDIQVELGSTATEYVPHELTSYKSIMKVSDGRFVTSFDERMPCKTKNLFISSTKTGNAGDFNNTTVRSFEENIWYIGLSRNNYNVPNLVYIHEIKDNYIKVATRGAGYGVARAFKVSPNKQYTISFKGNPSTSGVGFGFYDNTGKYLSQIADTFTVTTPTNCGWLAIVFGAYPVNTEFEYTDIQLELGTTATDYVPYGYV